MGCLAVLMHFFCRGCRMEQASIEEKFIVGNLVEKKRT